MAASTISVLLLSLLAALAVSRSAAQAEESGMRIMSDGFQWPVAMSVYGGDDGGELEEIGGGIEEIERRSLFWRKPHYYISYGALAANRVPCPPRSGRSYYTHNCFNSRAPANPYNRGCSRITRCRR